MRSRGLIHRRGRVLVLEMKFFSIGLRVGERLRAVILGGVRLLRWHHLWWRLAGSASHGAHATRRGYSLQVVVSRARGITQGILITQEVVDGVGIAPCHAHGLGRGLVPTHGLVHLPDAGVCGVA